MMRNTLYKPEYVDRAREICANGAINSDLAAEFDVGIETIRRWATKYPEFKAAITAAKEIADTRVERSLYERATGYTFESEKIFCNKEGLVTKVPYMEHVPPDTTAQIFWLKNRKPKEWRDKRELEVTGDPLAELLTEFRQQYESSSKAETADVEA